jgi:RND superfamily putative drug exporter
VRSVAAVGSWSASRPWRAIALWIAFVVVALGLGALTGTEELENGAVGESARGYGMLDAHGAWPPAREYAYLHSGTLRVEDPAFAAATREAASVMTRMLGDVDVRNAPDRHAVLLAAAVTRPVDIALLRTNILAVGAGHPRVTVEQTGDITAGEARDRIVDSDLQRAEYLAVPVTLLVLLFAFGAIFAALVPVVLALTAVAAASGLLGPISQIFPIEDATKIVVVLIGMAVGVDYALFYVIRSREERHRGLDSHAALERTARTSGRTVIVSGATVAIAMAGMFVIGTDVFNSVASGTITVVACAVIGSVTVLPAVLELMGDRIDRGRIPWLPHLSTETSESRFWPAVIDRVLRRPLLSCVLSAGALLALAVPVLWLSVAKPSDDSLATKGEPALATLARVQDAFPSAGAPAIVVVTGPENQRARVLAAITELERLAEGRGIVHPPFRTTGGFDNRSASIELPLTGAGDNTASRHAIEVLRDELVPVTLGRIPGLEVAVTGDTAEDVDFTDQMKHGMPYVIAFVLAFAFVLLLVAFRSLVVPLKAIVLNLLSVGAAYGVLVLVFQHSWAEGILGFESNGAIVSWLPPFLFVVLFGLSMDYHVFILSRVREGFDAGMPSDAAVRYGITATAGVVTSAALVMVGVFAIFGTLSSLDVKQAGVGLAAAVLIDATIVRAVLLPSSMHLLGDWNWYLPKSLGRFARRPGPGESAEVTS